MSATALLAFYAVAIAGASLFGGWLPSVVRMTHARVQLAMTFVAGMVLGVALCHLLPHSLDRLGGNSADVGAWWMLIGMVAMVLLLRVFHFHQHDFSDDDDEQASRAANPISWIALALGLGLHSMIEGVALGTIIRAESEAAHGIGLAGSGAFLAIFLHKPLDALSVVGTMHAAHLRKHTRALTNLAFALICPVGAWLTFWSVGSLGAAEDAVIGRALAFSAGAFLCISLSDLLPEIHFHSHDRGKLTVSFLAGISLAYAMRWVEANPMHG